MQDSLILVDILDCSVSRKLKLKLMPAGNRGQDKAMKGRSLEGKFSVLHWRLRQKGAGDQYVVCYRTENETRRLYLEELRERWMIGSLPTFRTEVAWGFPGSTCWSWELGEINYRKEFWQLEAKEYHIVTTLIKTHWEEQTRWVTGSVSLGNRRKLNRKYGLHRVSWGCVWNFPW